MKLRKVILLIVILGVTLVGGIVYWVDADSSSSESNSDDGAFEKVFISEDFYFTQGRSENRIRLNNGMSFANNRLHLKAEPNIPKRVLKQLAKKHGAEITCFFRRDFGDAYTFTFTENFTHDQLQELSATFAGLDSIIYAQIGIYSHVSPRSDQFFPDDPLWNRNWGLDAISAPEAWNFKDAMSDVRVLVIDTGFYENHEDLHFLSGPPLQGLPADLNHGTHVAGIIGATFNNATGISGSVPNPNAFMYGIQLLHTDEDGEQTYTLNDTKLMNLLQFYVMHHDVQVINYSMGNDLLEFAAYRGNENAIKALDQRTEYFEKRMLQLINGGYEFIFVQAAGNQHYQDPRGIQYSPCIEAYDECWGYCQEETGELAGINGVFSEFARIQNADVRSRIIIVGATQRNGNLASFSQRGDLLDVNAPGVNIYSTYSIIVGESDQEISLYKRLDGTSMAAPFVSGLAAMLFGVNPDLTGAEVREIIIETADGEHHIINASAAVNRAYATRVTHRE